jgi:hypothetical protein
MRSALPILSPSRLGEEPFLGPWAIRGLAQFSPTPKVRLSEKPFYAQVSLMHKLLFCVDLSYMKMFLMHRIIEPPSLGLLGNNFAQAIISLTCEYRLCDDFSSRMAPWVQIWLRLLNVSVVALKMWVCIYNQSISPSRLEEGWPIYYTQLLLQQCARNLFTWEIFSHKRTYNT